jgi:heat shock protein HslJ
MISVNLARLTGSLALAVSLAAVVVGCMGQTEPRSLVGTSWRLLTIESMDDAQGSTEIPDPSAFTVSFGEDGTANFQIDCNSGSGSFEAEPTGDGETGTLTFGPIATTLMGCPEPSLDQEVSAALPHVRGYIFKTDTSGKDLLHMSLMADGGILSWEPAP